jgi:hypothetical protein
MIEADLDRATYGFGLDGNVLVLTRTPAGATARFQRSQ